MANDIRIVGDVYFENQKEPSRTIQRTHCFSFVDPSILYPALRAYYFVCIVAISIQINVMWMFRIEFTFIHIITSARLHSLTLSKYVCVRYFFHFDILCCPFSIVLELSLADSKWNVITISTNNWNISRHCTIWLCKTKQFNTSTETNLNGHIVNRPIVSTKWNQQWLQFFFFI